jgi:hypothetical protein
LGFCCGFLGLQINSNTSPPFTTNEDLIYYGYFISSIDLLREGPY